MAVTPIHRAKTVKRMVVSTYQAASGAGQAAMEELEAQTKAVIEGTEVPMNIFPFQYAFNLFSHNAPMTENGYNEEVRAAAFLAPELDCRRWCSLACLSPERLFISCQVLCCSRECDSGCMSACLRLRTWRHRLAPRVCNCRTLSVSKERVQEMKMTNETRKIWSNDSVMAAATCIRVPVMRAHAEAINLELQDDIEEDEAREILGKAPGVSLLDDRYASVCVRCVPVVHTCPLICMRCIDTLVTSGRRRSMQQLTGRAMTYCSPARELSHCWCVFDSICSV